MDENDFIKFLGTAGARFVVAKQLRSSAGVFIKYHGLNIILDPGPGTLVKCASSNPPIDVTKIDAIILSHSHIDHSNDVNILIDSMTSGGFQKKGYLFAPKEALEGDNNVVLKYLRDFLTEIKVLKEKTEYKIGDLSFSTSIRHQHPVETYGLIFNMNGKKVSFIIDTKFFPDLIDSYKGSDILIMNVVRNIPHESGNVMHLCIDDVKKILKEIKPQKAIMTHLGMSMIKSEPWIIANDIKSELGIDTVAAKDDLKIDLSFDSKKPTKKEVTLFDF
jgi:phosphoribosyl 1,2-cyclic phosphodiesterase